MKSLAEKYRENAIHILSKSINQHPSRRTFEAVQRKAMQRTLGRASRVFNRIN